WKRRHPQIRFERQIEVGLKLDRRGEETAYRIVQEGLSNAVRHGRPAEIRIVLAEERGAACITVEDDGVGFAASENLGGMGLKGMAERVRAVNGVFKVEHRVRGTRVRAVLPGVGVREIRELEQA